MFGLQDSGDPPSDAEMLGALRSAYDKNAKGLRASITRVVDLTLIDADSKSGPINNADAQELGAALGARMAQSDPVISRLPLENIGPYRLLSIIGEGGYGVVYLAEQTEPVRRRVALKIIKPGMDSRRVINRFEQERQSLAVMDHPNIARVLDAGTTQRGLPFIVMEHIKGEPITTFCDKKNLTIRDRLNVFISVCEAVQHAHMKGIIHRDITPSNVLVAAGDQGPVVKVIDFGIAKALAHATEQTTAFTVQGQMIGTPEYVSPEQAEMGGTDIDTRTDVYSLGVLLYELLTGVTPFDPQTLRSASLATFQRIIRDVNPPKPSARLSSLGKAKDEILRHRQTEHVALSRELARELDWIPLKAMRKDRMERYRTPSDLADDVRNYLAGLPLEAGPESATYRARKFLRRNRAPTAIATGFFVAVAAFGVTMWVMAKRSDRQRQFADRTVAILQDAMNSIDPDNAAGRDTKLVREIVDKIAGQLPELRDDPKRQAQLHETLGIVYGRIGRTEDAKSYLKKASDFHADESTRDELACARVELHHAEVLNIAQDHGAAHEILRRIPAGSFRDISDRILALNTLGVALIGLDLREEALTTLAESRKLEQQADGVPIEDAIRTRTLIAWTHHLLRQNQKAVDDFQEVLELAQSKLDPEGFQVAKIKQHYAMALVRVNRIQEAEKLLMESLGTYEKMYGRSSLSYLSGLGYLSDVLFKEHRLVEAERKCRESLAGMQAPERAEKDCAFALRLLPQILEAQARTLEAPDYKSKLNEAERGYRNALSRHEKWFGSNHGETVRIRLQLDNLLKSRPIVENSSEPGN